MSKLDDVIITVEHAAELAGCTAHVLHTGPGRVDFCCSPHDEDAGWAGDLRVRWDRLTVTASLEHSGPVGRYAVDNTRAGWIAFKRWLERELG